MDLLDEAAPDFMFSETLASGPSVVLFTRGHWCSYCAERLGTFSALGYDLWRHHGVDVFPVMGDPRRRDAGPVRPRPPTAQRPVARGRRGIHRRRGPPAARRDPDPGDVHRRRGGHRPVRPGRRARGPSDLANYVRHVLNDDLVEPL